MVTPHIIDPSIDPNRGKPGQPALTGAQNWEWYNIAPSSSSQTQILFKNPTMMGTNRFYQDRAQISQDMTFVIKGDAATGIPLEDSFCIKPFPLSQCTRELDVTFNGLQIQERPADTLLSRIQQMKQARLNKVNVGCPYQKILQGDVHTTTQSVDITPPTETSAAQAEYNQATYDFAVGSDIIISRRIKNAPFNGGHPTSLFLNRGKVSTPDIYSMVTSFNTLTTNAATSKEQFPFREAVIQFHFYEPIFCPPFNQYLFDNASRPIYNLNSIDVSFYLNQLIDMVHFDQQPGLYEVKSATITNPRLLLKVASTSIERPLDFHLPISRQIPFRTAFSAPIQPSVVKQTITVNSDALTLDRVPSAIYISCQLARTPSNQHTAQMNSQVQLPIQTINITWGNRTQILATASAFDLWSISKQNGLADTSFAQFSGYRKGSIPLLRHSVNQQEDPGNETGGWYEMVQVGSGSFIKLVPGIDIVIPGEQLIPGEKIKNTVFKVQITSSGLCAQPPVTVNNQLLFAGLDGTPTSSSEVLHIPIRNGENAQYDLVLVFEQREEFIARETTAEMRLTPYEGNLSSPTISSNLGVFKEGFQNSSGVYEQLCAVQTEGVKIDQVPYESIPQSGYVPGPQVGIAVRPPPILGEKKGKRPRPEIPSFPETSLTENESSEEEKE